jgi:hypothetical protein
MLRRYVDSFRIYADPGRDDEEARLGWSRFVAQTLAIGLLLALGLRLVQAWSLDGPHAPFNWIAVVTGVAARALVEGREPRLLGCARRAGV